ncbi:hypothetical protein [Streptomyces sp. NPDC048341]|uniref:hypothetical protein n=1 Tax=Streptomyces sp. NPDC048341 TaxID=3154620 RepID=UPI00343C9777
MKPQSALAARQSPSPSPVTLPEERLAEAVARLAVLIAKTVTPAPGTGPDDD